MAANEKREIPKNHEKSALNDTSQLCEAEVMYNATINACRERWQMALSLLLELERPKIVEILAGA